MKSYLTIPNFFSFGAFVSAFLGIYLAISGFFLISFIIILLGFIFDILDGYFARKCKQTSEFGKQLDSHIDVFLYLIYPIIIFYLYFEFQNIYWLLVYFLFLFLGIFRLIRTNLVGFEKDFLYKGVPVVFSLLLIIFFEILKNIKFLEFKFFELICLVILIIFSIMMVLPFKFPKPKNIKILILGLFFLILFLLKNV